MEFDRLTMKEAAAQALLNDSVGQPMTREAMLEGVLAAVRIREPEGKPGDLP
jgi:hypothetical protein